MVKRYRVRRDGGPRGVAMPLEHPTGPSYMSYGVVPCPKRRHASPRCGPLTDGDDTVVDVLRQRCRVNIIKYSERDKIMSFLHDVGTCAIGLMVIFHSFW